MPTFQLDSPSLFGSVASDNAPIIVFHKSASESPEKADSATDDNVASPAASVSPWLTPSPLSTPGLSSCPTSCLSTSSSLPSISHQNKTRTRRARPDHIPRPPNSFILHQSGHSTGQNQRQVGEDVGALWNQLSEDEKQPFRLMASKAKEEHAKRYPDYIYSPNVRSPRKSKATLKLKALKKRKPGTEQNDVQSTSSATSSDASPGFEFLSFKSSPSSPVDAAHRSVPQVLINSFPVASLPQVHAYDNQARQPSTFGLAPTSILFGPFPSIEDLQAQPLNQQMMIDESHCLGHDFSAGNHLGPVDPSLHHPFMERPLPHSYTTRYVPLPDVQSDFMPPQSSYNAWMPDRPIELSDSNLDPLHLDLNPSFEDSNLHFFQSSSLQDEQSSPMAFSQRQPDNQWDVQMNANPTFRTEHPVADLFPGFRHPFAPSDTDFDHLISLPAWLDGLSLDDSSIMNTDQSL